MFNPQNQNAESVSRWMSEHINERTDPASKAPGSPPLYGNDAVPHTLTFQSLVGSFSRAYINPDKALNDSLNNAYLMENDIGLLESVECRRRLTAMLDWEIKPEDEKCPYQVSLAQELQRIVGRIKYFTNYRMHLMNAIWYGRSGIQHRYGYNKVNGSFRMMPTPLHRDHNGWMPVHGDKLVFRYEDNVQNERDSGAYAHQMGLRIGTNLGDKVRLHRDYELEPVSDGLALFLKPYERDTFVVHKHFIEDAAFQHSFFAGSIHGVGIRSKIYWEWFLKQEAFAFLTQYLERSAGGIEVWTYPMGDEKALEKTKQAARERLANGRNCIFFPKPLGDDSDSYKFEIIEPGAMGLDIMQSIVENYYGGRIKRYILGQELSTEAKATGMGSGVAEAHMDTLAQIVQFDASNLEETLTYELVRYIQQLNFPETMGWHMRFSLKTRDENTAERLAALNSAYQMGASIAESEVFKILGLSAPTTGQKVLSLSSQQNQQMQQQMAMQQAQQPQMPMDGQFGGDESEDEEPIQGGKDDTEGSLDGDPVDIVQKLIDQYIRQAMDERDRYANQLSFQWDEKLHPRESGSINPAHAGEFTAKNTGIFGKAPQKQKFLFGNTAGVPARKSSRVVAQKINKIFADHAQHKQKQLNFDSAYEHKPEVPEHHKHAHAMLDEILKHVDSVHGQNTDDENYEATPEPQEPVKPKRRMAGQGMDAKATAAPSLPPAPIVRQEQRTSEPADEPSKPPEQKSYRQVVKPESKPDNGKSVYDQQDKGIGSKSEGNSWSKERRDQFVMDHMKHVGSVVRFMASKGYSKGDPDSAESAAYEGLMNAARRYDENNDKGYSEEKFAKQGMAQAIRNLNRKKMDKAAIDDISGSDDEYDAMGQLADHRSNDPSESTEDNDHLDQLNEAMKILPENEEWLFRQWAETPIHPQTGKRDTQGLIDAYNDTWGHLHKKPVTRASVFTTNGKIDQIKKKLQSILPAKKYAIVREYVIRYGRIALEHLPVERYAKSLETARADRESILQALMNWMDA